MITDANARRVFIVFTVLIAGVVFAVGFTSNPAAGAALLAVCAFVYAYYRLVTRTVPIQHPGGHCQNCGYDLRQIRVSQCPECGTEC